jgi:hypothetical protein
MALGFALAILASGFAQAAAAPDQGGHRKKPRTGAPSATSAPSDAERAARLAEGRKKFFEQSTGFDNGDPVPPVTTPPSPSQLWPYSGIPKLKR